MYPNLICSSCQVFSVVFSCILVEYACWWERVEGIAMADEFVTMREAQDILGVSNFTVWQMVKDGRLRAFRSEVDRRKKLIRRADLEALMAPKSGQGSQSEKTAA